MKKFTAENHSTATMVRVERSLVEEQEAERAFCNGKITKKRSLKEIKARYLKKFVWLLYEFPFTETNIFSKALQKSRR